jgi:hypothetical protein
MRMERIVAGITKPSPATVENGRNR